ncbi:BOI-related E3 ubiquitin-protein ligase 1-like [Actinidia eriantha]|uniref:BOI-related E3 ubiquitin-protein ligase 1-like n=1 Tax=Actinidia eriantha TaxID=165200 RepID=UPI0025889BE6|nr:BOI-related E3 ubiquitin-protein ligase 1-like [Actinidia eriantha]
MAVQAQYPSNTLFLNRSVQNGKNPPGNDYSLQPQLDTGGFLDQSHMIFTDGVGTNSRKRGRELTETAPSINPFSLQSQPHQLIDLSQLHTPQQNVVSTGLRLAFGEQQQLQQKQKQQQTLFPQSSVLFSLLPEDFAAQIRQQRDEIDQFLRAQGEHMRRTLAENRQRHYHALLGAAEESVARRLREKETEAEKAARLNAELQATAARLSAEAQGWRSAARAHEATAAALQARLQQAMTSGGGWKDGGEEVAGGGEAEDGESAYVDPDRVEVSSGPGCKACRKRVASVVVLPCRHLSLCTECGPLAQTCPLCYTFRESSVEVFFS